MDGGKAGIESAAATAFSGSNIGRTRTGNVITSEGVSSQFAFEPVGSNQSKPLEARLIAASNKPLEAEVEAKRFRSDLLFRINVVAFDLAPLRDERSIIPTMVAQFVAEFARKAQRDIVGVTPLAMGALRAYRWPGNVRELRNAIERAVALRMDGLIDINDLPAALRDDAPMPAVTVDAGAPLAQSRSEAEAICIADTLRRNKNNRLRTAIDLGISRMTLYKKLHRYGLLGAAE